ncbi:MAG TPA: cache domain-containing protein, partial [Burkholderiaceae bacterium]|nr:cache domain-containing protein [Burkholderiaceae bacterium]
MKRRWKLFPKYALLIIALVTVMVLASGAVSIYFSHRENQNHLVALQDEKAQGAATRIEQYVQGIEHQLSWTALPRVEAGGSSGDALEARRIEYLKLLRQAPAITEVAWIDARGREQLRVSRLAMDTRDGGADVSQEPKFREASAGQTYYGPVYFRKGTEPYLTIARPAGSAGGVTAAEVNLKFVWEVVSRIRIGEKGLAYVVDAGGTLIAHPDISLVLKKTDLRALPQVAALAEPQGRAPDGARDLQGEPVLSAFARIPTLGWAVFVEAPRAEAYAPLYATLQRMGLVLVAALLVSAAASYLLARALVRPLRALQEGAAQIGAGELDRHIEVRTGDELEGLAEQFNQMGAALRASYGDLERKVEERTAELSQALERQTATAQILRVISASPTSVQPVLDAVAERSGMLCHAEGSRVWLAVDGELRAMTSYGPAYGNPETWYPTLPLRITSPGGRAFIERRAVLVEDVRALIDTEYPDVRELQARHGFRTVLAVPLLREGEAIGIIGLLRNEVRRFTQAEIGLVQTFANQAVIAIENVRLFNETREALEQQTASAEILQVISASVADTKPVFDKILESCSKLFDTTTQAIVLVGDDGQLHLAGQGGQASGRLQGMYPRPLAGSASELAMRERRVLHYRDALSGEDVHPVFREAAQHVGLGPYSVAVAPMLWEDRGIGALFMVRMPPSGFSDKELALLKT